MDGWVRSEARGAEASSVSHLMIFLLSLTAFTSLDKQMLAGWFELGPAAAEHLHCLLLRPPRLEPRSRLQPAADRNVHLNIIKREIVSPVTGNESDQRNLNPVKTLFPVLLVVFEC